MPVADIRLASRVPFVERQSTIMEMSHQISSFHLDGDNLEDRIEPTREQLVALGESLLWEIDRLREEIETCQKEEVEAKKSAERMIPSIKDAQDSLSKAIERKETLVKKNQFLELKLQDLYIRLNKSTDYWKKYGLDVKQISKPEDPYEEYEFTFSDLQKRKSKRSMNETAVPTGQNDANQTPTNANGQLTTYSINLRYQDKKLEIVYQVNQVLSTENLAQLNEKLTHHCVNQEDGSVNYRSAMTLIRQDLMRSLFPSPKTCSHPPAETNSHTCT